MDKTPRNLWIDCLRGVSILSVLATHGLIPIATLLPFPEKYAISLVGNGYYGVAIFFVVSGFLITSNTLRRYGQLSAVDFGQFYAMRAARIMPLLLLFLAAMLALALLRIGGFIPPSWGLAFSGVYSALTFQYHLFYISVGNVGELQAWS